MPKRIKLHRTRPGIKVQKVELIKTDKPYGYYHERKRDMRYLPSKHRPGIRRFSCATCTNLRWGEKWGRGYYKCAYLGISSSGASDVLLRARCRKYHSRYKLTDEDRAKVLSITSRRLYTKMAEYKELNKNILNKDSHVHI